MFGDERRNRELFHRSPPPPLGRGGLKEWLVLCGAAILAIVARYVGRAGVQRMKYHPSFIIAEAARG